MKTATIKLGVLLIALGAHARPSLALGGGTLPLGGESDVPLIGNGTLPLRLGGGDGTLPLVFSGAATMGGSSQLATEVTITQADAQAFSDPTDALLRCQTRGPDVSKHSAAGSVVVGGATYAIKGICYAAGSRLMEVVAERPGAAGAEQSVMVMILGGARPAELSGSMTLIGPSPRSGRFTFDVKSPHG